VVKNTKRIPTETSSFGVSRRESHDSSKFYGRKLYAGSTSQTAEQEVENTVPEKYLDTVICKSSEQMDELPDSSIHLVITSPPYNVGKTYDNDLTQEEYRSCSEKSLQKYTECLSPADESVSTSQTLDESRTSRSIIM